MPPPHWDPLLRVFCQLKPLLSFLQFRLIVSDQCTVLSVIHTDEQVGECVIKCIPILPGKTENGKKHSKFNDC